MKELTATTPKTTNKEWSPNATQKAFMETLKEYPDGATLIDIAIDKNVEFKSGAINVLVSKGLVSTEKVDRVADIVYRGIKIGEKKDSVNRYRLA